MKSIDGFYRKITLGLRGLLGYAYKYAVDCKIQNIPSLGRDNHSEVIVSLTSYGRRVKNNVVYYTIVSLLRQTIQPKKIVLWLADNEWSEDTIPAKLKKLKGKGIEICFCEDIRSYKKLVPSLNKFKGETIITVDDDVIYSNDTIETLLKEHHEHPNEIISLHAAEAKLKDGIPADYSSWPDLKDNKCGRLVFPIGEGGVLYPVGSLHEDVLRKELFMKLSPLADDIWFWICGLRTGTSKRYVTKTKHNYSFDDFYQFFHNGAALTHNNRFENSNDVQFKNVFEYYNIKLDSEGIISNQK